MLVTIKRKNLMMFSIVFAVILIFVITFSTIKNSYKSPLKIGITVIIDAGHGGIDSGTSGINTGIKESDLNLSVAKELQIYFNTVEINTVMTRDTSGGLYGSTSKGFKSRDMAKRKDIINGAKPDLVISVHMNKYPQSYRQGAQAFFVKNSENSQLAAKKVQFALNKEINKRAYEALVGDYYILNCTNYVSILVECGFLSNAEDEALLATAEHRKKVAYQIFCGAMEYLTITSYEKFM